MRTGLGQDGLQHAATNIRQPEIAALEAVSEGCVVDAEQVEHGGVQVVHMHHVLYGVVA